MEANKTKSESTEASQKRQERRLYEFRRNMVAMWVLRSFLYNVCKFDPHSPYKFLFDACNDVIGDGNFGVDDFFTYAPMFGVNPYEIQKMANDAIPTHR